MSILFPENIMYWRQNTYKKTLQWTQLLDLRVNFTVTKYVVNKILIFSLYLHWMILTFWYRCRTAYWRTWVSPLNEWRSELQISVSLNFTGFAIQTFSFVFEGFMIYPWNNTAFSIFTWGKISCRADSSMNKV